MRPTHDHPLPGDLIIRPAHGEAAVQADGLYFIAVYPHIAEAPPTSPGPLPVVIEQAARLEQVRAGAVVVWREEPTTPSRYIKLAVS
jgi:hypothetical protein